jgi:Cu-Zn family superoxide dismutase
MSAGGHLDLPAAAGLAGHAGDLTNLYVNRDGTGSMTFVVDRFTVADLMADGGRAVIVHADPDNFMNIPDRYGVTPDATTMETGDAGARLACGVASGG